MSSSRSELRKLAGFLLKPRSMDWEYATTQLFSVVTNPRKVYRLAASRKQVRNSWARDDPAVIVIQILFLVAAALLWGLVYEGKGFLATLWLVFRVVFFHYLGTGLIVATAAWKLCNTYLLASGGGGGGGGGFVVAGGAGRAHAVEQRVEWRYALDVHVNAFFPVFLLLYVLQFLLLPVVSGNGFFSAFVANFLFFVAACAYNYVSHLGYRTLPFLKGTEVFLWPIAISVFLFLFCSLMGMNASHLAMYLVFGDGSASQGLNGAVVETAAAGSAASAAATPARLR